MEYGEILYEAMQLPEKQKHQLVYALSRGFAKVMITQVKRDNCKKQLWFYLNMLSKRLGILSNAILAHDRLRIHVNARWVIWNRLYDEGYSQNMIADVSGFKHNIIQVGMKRIMEVKTNPAYDPELATIYELFQNALKDENII